ncbi:hypothetical protein D030_3496B, partial [Vibrio parahaemolyticus AQ3810]
TMR